MVLETIQSDAPMLIPVCYALAVGCFLYVGTTEIVAEEISHVTSKKAGLFKFAAFLAGLVVVTLILTFAEMAH